MIDHHRRIGVEPNNALWDEIAEGSLTPQLPDTDRQELLYAAYASTYHWIQAGDAANRARGEHLISRVALALGYHLVAATPANRCLERVEANPDVVEDWDLASPTRQSPGRQPHTGGRRRRAPPAPRRRAHRGGGGRRRP